MTKLRFPRFLTVQEVLDIQQAVVSEHGGSFGLRDPSMLDSAVHTPQATFGSEWLYPSLFDMAAAYLIHLALNHPFVDGNKRTAWVSMRIFLRLNGFRLKPRRKDAVQLVVHIAEGQMRDWRQVSEWIAQRAEETPSAGRAPR